MVMEFLFFKLPFCTDDIWFCAQPLTNLRNMFFRVNYRLKIDAFQGGEVLTPTLVVGEALTLSFRTQH